MRWQRAKRDASKFVTDAGGKVLGANVYPFPETTDFSAALVQAQASGAKVIGLANSGLDTVNSIKQAHEFGITKAGQKLAGLIMYTTDVHSIGLETGQGLLLSESYYWDLNNRTRAFMNRIKTRFHYGRIAFRQVNIRQPSITSKPSHRSES